MGKFRNQRQYATAPYNFVTLNEDKVIEGKEIPLNDKYYNKLNTGEIKLNIKSLTPLFIRGKAEEFYKVDGKYAIPGSSIRGMVKTLIEILSWAKFNSVNSSNHIYFRNIGDKFYKDKFLQGTNPVKNMVKSGWLKFENGQYSIYPSIYTNVNGVNVQYYKLNGDYANKGNEFLINSINGNAISKVVYSNLEEIFINTSNVVKYHKKRIERNGRVQFIDLEYNEIVEFSFTPYKSFKKAYLVVSGFVKGKHYNWVVNPPEGNPLSISTVDFLKIIDIYKEDKTRNVNFNLIEKSERYSRDGGLGFPCFYLEDSNGKLMMIGHTGMFRLMHDYNVECLLPPIHKADDSNKHDLEKHDFVTALFGNSEFASRLFFEDCKAIDAVEMPEEALNILSSPSISYFPNYLEQPDKHNTDKNNTHHWSTKDAKLRGYKLYWHKHVGSEYLNSSITISSKDLIVFLDQQGFSFKEFTIKYSKYLSKHDHDKIQFNCYFSELPTEIKIFIHSLIHQEKDDKDIKREGKVQFTTAKVLNVNSEFIGTIKFENLTEEELGALLFSLELPANMAHKIGMGKPLGLGSVKLNVTLKICNIQSKYNSLLNTTRTKFNDSYKSIASTRELKAKFAKFIFEELGIPCSNEPEVKLWDHERLKDLRHLLSVVMIKNPNWNELTKYMELEIQNNNLTERPFADRRILPTPSDLLKISNDK